MKRLLLILILLCFALPIQAQVFTLIEILLNSASTEEPEFTIFLFILSQSDDTLINDFGRTDNEWTIFAPSDEAFRVFMEANNLRLRDLMNDEALLQDLLHYHIVMGSFTYADLADTETLTPLLADSEIAITASEEAIIHLNDRAEIIIENVAARNSRSSKSP
jgi:uncharacterized surface protein with fasciclin (FAS1) repeats